ncbi:hypothetical protein RhiirC2_752969 [Rhizophagus irregularis]|uniref:Protein kinase domain-containing protein n=1 Tax=Rhizophagus irregularis TaxID=588596 RepID=A0A2N1MYN6_9GLOM|nr:hypothetical protein RhiirC2_752969 [Rhizophagus irregularis]
MTLEFEIRRFIKVQGIYVMNTGHIPPEVWIGGIVSIKSDIYSLGVIMQEISEGYGSNTPQCYHELMQKCKDNDPEKRPDPLDLLEELHIFTASPLRKRQFEDADSRGLQMNLSSPLQTNLQSPPPQTNPPSEYFSNQQLFRPFYSENLFIPFDNSLSKYSLDQLH